MKNRRKVTIDDMHMIAKQRAGKCLSRQYIRDSSNLIWECSEGHRWEATPNNIKKGTWCSKCGYENARLGMQKMREIAHKNQGFCLTQKYTNSTTPLTWKCSKGHIWDTAPTTVISGSWCPECYRERQTHTIEFMQETAAKKNGKCISESYSGSESYLFWKCEEGHEWKAKPKNVLGGSWCPTCAIEKKRLGIEKMKSLAVLRGGLCLSKQYRSRKHQLSWKCQNGHEWKATPETILKEGWCPTCSQEFYFSEEICRTVFEQIFNAKFPNLRPKWLENSIGNRLELDGYCAELKIAFEYQGRQHFEIGFFGSTQLELDAQKSRDAEKKEICEANGVQLFIIHFSEDLRNLPNLIQEEFVKCNLDISIHPSLQNPNVVM